MRKEIENTGETGEMRRRRETMADGKRYIIYYTFGGIGDGAAGKTERDEVKENV